MGMARTTGGNVSSVQISARIDQALEEVEDIEDLKKTRHEPMRLLSEVLAELDLDGKA